MKFYPIAHTKRVFLKLPDTEDKMLVPKEESQCIVEFPPSEEKRRVIRNYLNRRKDFGEVWEVVDLPMVQVAPRGKGIIKVAEFINAAAKFGMGWVQAQIKLIKKRGGEL